MHANAFFLVHLDLGFALVFSCLILLHNMVRRRLSLVAGTSVQGSVHVRFKCDFDRGKPLICSLLLLWYIVLVFLLTHLLGLI